jgi:hypothetical protein
VVIHTQKRRREFQGGISRGEAIKKKKLTEKYKKR